MLCIHCSGVLCNVVFSLLSASAHAFKHKLGLTDWLADWVSQHYLPPQTWSQNFIESHAHKWYFIVLKSLHYRSITKVALCLLCLLLLNEVANLMRVDLLATDWIHSCIICRNSAPDLWSAYYFLIHPSSQNKYSSVLSNQHISISAYQTVCADQSELMLFDTRSEGVMEPRNWHLCGTFDSK